MPCHNNLDKWCEELISLSIIDIRWELFSYAH